MMGCVQKHHPTTRMSFYLCLRPMNNEDKMTP